ncbi:MAG TPA: ATP-binding protein [Gemmataceae bacterium]|nr:ATP-binding protein [Gemmataceae bacterium]
MTGTDVAHQLETVGQRLARLSAAAEQDSASQNPLSPCVLKELQAALQELQAVREGLRHQNEELSAARRTAEVQRQRYHDLFEFAPDGYVVTDMEGTIWESNQAAATLLQTAQSALVRKPLIVFIAEDHRETFRSRLSELRRREGTGEWEVQLQARSGQVMDAAAKVGVIRDADGRALGLRWLFRDISERKRTEEQVRHFNQQLERRVQERTAELEAANHLKDEWLLREQVARAAVEAAQARLAFLAEASHVLASSLDYHTTLDHVASLAVPHLADWCIVSLVEEDGSIRPVAVGHTDPKKVETVRDLYRNHPINPTGKEGTAKVIRTGKPELYPKITDSQLAAIARDPEHLKRLRELGARAAVVMPLTARGRTLGALMLVSAESGRTYGGADLTWLEDLAGRIAAAIDNARLYCAVQDADRRRNDFLAMVAHQLRNPLAPLRNAIDLLRMPLPNSTQVHQAQGIAERQIRILTRLVEDLLDITRLSRGKMELKKERIELATIVRRAVEAVRPLVNERRHQLGETLPQSPVPLDADPLRLEQVLVNLLSNAARYTEPGGRIWLTVAREQDHAVVRVRDSGIGIGPELLPHLFNPAEQSQPAALQTGAGLGLGLTLARRLVELHGGSIQATSAGPNQGSEFVVRLPIARSQPNARSGPAVLPSVEPNGPPRRVLLVDDNIDAADTLAMLLQLWGHQVDVAHNAEEALHLTDQHVPDLILLDIGLPGTNGYELARQLREQPGLEHTLLIALTGYGQDEDRRRSHEAGIASHLVKPVNPGVLQKLLDRLEVPA